MMCYAIKHKEKGFLGIRVNWRYEETELSCDTMDSNIWIADSLGHAERVLSGKDRYNDPLILYDIDNLEIVEILIREVKNVSKTNSRS